jgi:hypothetical protein
VKVPQVVKDLRTPERRIAWGLTADGLPLVATGSTLYAGLLELAWVDVEKVSWQPPLLTVTEVAEVEGAGATHTWEVAEDARLAETVRARVTSSIGWTGRRALGLAGHVRLVGRRVPDRDPLRWQVVFEAGTDPQDPRLRAQAELLVEELRRTIG